MQTYETIPQPRPYPLIGNLLDLRPPNPVQSLMALAGKFGPIYRIKLPGRKVILLSSQALVDEVCDQQRFHKNLSPALRNVRAFTGDGLFTSWTHEPNWRKAHNILLPNFSQQAMQGYFPMMVEMTDQLLDKWQRLNAGDEVNVVDDMTRLTLDTIGLCGFNYRFNSFYREDAHPFVDALLRALTEALRQLSRLPGQGLLMPGVRRQFEADIAYMNTMVDTIIQDRKAGGHQAGVHRDLLGYMLEGVDKQTGEQLDDVNISYQIITFLGAGHETTSGLLSFAIYYLLKNPEIMARAQAEMDRLLGGDRTVMPTYAQVNRFEYVQQILKETLRLWPTAPAFSLAPEEATVLGGKYRIDHDDTLSVLIPMLHRDQSVWGKDVAVFNPERFTSEREAALPANAYKPFGNGVRACIGRQFALQEAALALGLILHRFDLTDHRRYTLEVRESLTIKPANLFIRVQPRPSTTAAGTAAPVVEHARPAAPVPSAAPVTAAASAGQTPLLVLFGSNMGTAEGIAQQVGAAGQGLNFGIQSAPLDEYVNRLPTTGAVLIVTSSYNGTPPDNAVKFCNWLRDSAADAVAEAERLKGVKFAVFGCGHRDWAATYQAVPKLIDSRLQALGAERIHVRGEGDGRDDFDGQFQDWLAALWPAVGQALAVELGPVKAGAASPQYEVETVPDEPAWPYAAAFGARRMTVLENRELQRANSAGVPERSTRHLEIALPEGVTYQAGDYLGVIPRNSPEQVRRAAARFGLSPAARIRLRRPGGEKTHLPVDQPVQVGELLAAFFDLQDTATRAQIAVLAEHNECPPEKARLLALAGSDPESAAHYRAEVLDKHKSLLNLLEEFPAVSLPFPRLLALLPPLRPRYYSISSSPLTSGRQASLTVAVLNGPALSGRGSYAGICSTYLAGLQPGSEIYAFVSNPNSPFRLPADPSVPIILIGPGTGLAPLRGFLQERAALLARGEKVGPSLLFTGCRHPEQDFIYADELRAFEAAGVTRLCSSFSRVPGQPKRYVQNEMEARQDELWSLLQNGASIYICGDARHMAPEVRQAFGRLYRDKTGGNEAAAESWLAGLTASHRYLADVWAAT
jgi:cytochrome P450/NADPH-cytochrome P450 reductase